MMRTDILTKWRFFVESDDDEMVENRCLRWTPGPDLALEIPLPTWRVFLLVRPGEWT